MSPRHDIAAFAKDEPTLADEAMRLLLKLGCWFTLYAISLFTTLAAAPGFLQWLGGAATFCVALYCVHAALQLYRVNKVMRDINK